ncbi:MAG: 2-phospho-L-lactate guanylyltransferase [Dehalococcoidia bacterium]|nr:2-phospho-L-lactate guanylyltransferase [Dehalococcoidia bacterium]
MPMKPIAEGKTRLTPALTDDHRSLLSLGMLLRVIGSAVATPELGDVIVYGGDDAVRRACSRMGAGWRPDPGVGLNGCLGAAFSDAHEEGIDQALFLPADLPLVTTAMISEFIRAGAGAQVAIAPDRASDGTNALLVDLAVDFPTLLGEASFNRHTGQADRLGAVHIVHRSSGLGLDIDTASDLKRLVEETPHLWDDLRREIREAGLESALPTGPVKERAE